MATLIRRTPFRFSDASEDNSHVHVPLLSAPSSTFEPSAALDALRRKALQPFDDSDPRHLLALETLWHCAFPGGLHPQPFERTSKQWSQLGFQGLDPCTDLRGGGYLALEHLLKFVVGARGEFDPSFPLAIASINCTAMLTRHFGLSPTLVLPFPGGTSTGQAECPTAALHALLEHHHRGTDALQALHAALLSHLMRAWASLAQERPARTMLDFPVALGRTFQQLCAAVARAPPATDWLQSVSQRLELDSGAAAPALLTAHDCCAHPGAVLALLLLLLRAATTKPRARV